MNSKVKILCSKCKLFYGNDETEQFCSICYKTVKSDDDMFKKDVLMEEKKEEISFVIGVIPQQVNKDQCWKCQKKVGYLGFACKCSYIFCGFHRHFTEHNCNYDYKTFERERLRKETPLIVTKKV